MSARIMIRARMLIFGLLRSGCVLLLAGMAVPARDRCSRQA
jgi:hypothetical protein